VHYHLAPAWLARRDASDRPAKRAFGPWLRGLLTLCARFRGLRDGPLDPFRFGADRALERRHRTKYEEDLRRIRAVLAGDTFDLCRELAELPLAVRGYGAVRRESYDRAAARRRDILAALGPTGTGKLAAE
jgi:indolepyruvate ferredoxin oxidoreductase